MLTKLSRRIFLTTFALVVLVGTTAASFAQGQSAGKRVLIGFKGGAGRQAAQQHRTAVSNLGGAVHDSFHIIPVVSARLPEQAIDRLRNNPQVEYIEDDIIMHVVEQTVDWGANRIQAPTAWTTSRGAGVHVAILDTGIDYDHPDLVSQIDGGIYFAGGWVDEILGNDGSTNPAYWDDGFGHGTHCAGIVAAEDNNIGAVGVAPDARLHAVKVLDDTGSGYISDIIQGIQWCVDHSIDVASMSFGGGGTASLQSACNAAYSAGVLLVAAAGNEYGGPVIYPAAYSSVIAVSATDSGDNIASFSNIGSQVELAAPGVSIYSTVPATGDPRIVDPSGYNYLSGTSMACPHVSGTAALVIAAGITDVRNQLRATAVDLGAVGKDIYYGYGLVNAAAAVEGSGGTTPSVVAAFFGDPKSGSAPLSVQFTDLSTGGITSWSWDFGDGGTSTLQNPSHTYDDAGTYTVSLTVSGSGGGEDTETKYDYITVNGPAPETLVADFAGSPTSGDAPLAVNFTDLSSGNPVSWGWDFGDSIGSSFVRNPSYTYSQPGTYDVTLIISDGWLIDMVTKVGYITVTGQTGNSPTAQFSATPTSGNAPLTVNFTDLSTENPNSWSWDFGDTGTSTAQNPSHIYNVTGTYTVTLTATNANGSGSETKQNYINVSAPPAPDTMHVGDLDGQSIKYTKGNWGASVTVTVHDASHNPVAGAEVWGEFTQNGSYSEDMYGTTGSDGTCTLISAQLPDKKGKAAVTFVVVSVSGVPLNYDSDANHDAEGDSDGTNITVNK